MKNIYACLLGEWVNLSESNDVVIDNTYTDANLWYKEQKQEKPYNNDDEPILNDNRNANDNNSNQRNNKQNQNVDKLITMRTTNSKTVK